MHVVQPEVISMMGEEFRVIEEMLSTTVLFVSMNSSRLSWNLTQRGAINACKVQPRVNQRELAKSGIQPGLSMSTSGRKA